MNRKKQRVIAFGFASAVGVAGFAHAGVIDLGTTNLNNGTQFGSASFSWDNVATLTVTLSNTAGSRGDPSWLTGLFWRLNGADIASANTPIGDIRTQDTVGDGFTDTPAGASNDADHLWGFESLASGWSTNVETDPGVFEDFSGAFGGGNQNYGVGAAGFGVFGTALDGLTAVNGPQGGVVSSSVDWATEGFPDQDGEEFLWGSIAFTFNLTNIEGSLSISDVAMVWGTGFDEVVLIPLPAALPMGLLGLAGVVVLRRRLAARQMA